MPTVDSRNFIVFFLGRDPGTLKSDIVSKKHPQLICPYLRLSNWKSEDWNYGNRPYCLVKIMTIVWSEFWLSFGQNYDYCLVRIMTIVWSNLWLLFGQTYDYCLVKILNIFCQNYPPSLPRTGAPYLYVKNTCFTEFNIAYYVQFRTSIYISYIYIYIYIYFYLFIYLFVCLTPICRGLGRGQARAVPDGLRRGYPAVSPQGHGW